MYESGLLLVTLRVGGRGCGRVRVVAREGGWAGDGGSPRYLQVDLSRLAFRLDRDPGRAEIPVVCDEQLVVEFYAR